MEATGLSLLLDDIPERVKKKWGGRAMHEGASFILINTNGEALAMDTVWSLWTVGWSAQDDNKFAKQCGIDTSKHTFKCTAPLSQLIGRNCNWNQLLLVAFLSYAHKYLT